MTDLLTAAGAAADVLFATDAPHGRSLALLVQQGGEVVFERYGTQPDTLFGPGSPVDANTTLISWSMAKSITHAALGMAVLDGLLDVPGIGPATLAAMRPHLRPIRRSKPVPQLP